jgi:GNAT superfamily N-acetyltransferase
VIELLNAGHVLDGFDSGEQEINDFLIRSARAHAEAGYSQTWVTVGPDSRQVQGFVSMAASSQPVRWASGGAAKVRLGERFAAAPFNRVPVLLIAYWGVRKEVQRRGVGNTLLNFAFTQAASMAKTIGITGIILEALNDALVPRYEKMGFVLLPYPEREKRRMFMDMPTAVAAVDAMRQAAGAASTLANPGSSSPV